jgi:hypothetical protein
LLSLVHFSYPFGLIKKWSFWSGSQSLFFRSWGQRTQCTNATIFFSFIYMCIQCLGHFSHPHNATIKHKNDSRQLFQAEFLH